MTLRPWPIFRVEVYSFEPSLYTAPTRSKARWRAFEAFREYRSSESFVEFLERGVKISKVETPLADDGYDNVRAQYGVSPSIGTTYRLDHEGPNSGREVLCLYPGKHTCMIHCAYEGAGRAMIVHPMNIRPADGA